MRCHLILLLVTICVTSAPMPDMKNNAKRGRFIRIRNGSQVLPVGRSSRGQAMPILRFRSRVLSRPNSRFVIPWSRNFSARNSRTKRPTTGPMTQATNRGTSSLRAINIGPPRNYRRNRFFAMPTRSRSLAKSYRGRYRMPASRLSMTRNGWSRRITLPKKFLSRDTGKRIVTIPIQFHPTKENVSDIRSSLGDKTSSKRLTDTQRGPVPGRSAFRSSVRGTVNRRGDPRALSAPRSFFSYPRATNVGFRSRITDKQQVNGQSGSRVPQDTYPTRPRTLTSTRKIHSNRIPSSYSRRFFKGARSRLHPFSVRNPVIPGFRSFDRRNSPSFRFRGAGILKNNTTQARATFMESSPAEISQNDHNSTNFDTVSNLKSFIADQSGEITGTGDGNSSGSVSTTTGFTPVFNESDNTTVANQTLLKLVLNGSSNADDVPPGSASKTPDIDFEIPNADAPVPDDRNMGGGTRRRIVNRDLEDLSWLTRIVDTPDGLEEAMDDGQLISRLQQTGPHAYADLMAALRKGSYFNDEVIVELQNEGLWEPFLRAAGIRLNDRIERRRSRLGWLTDFINKMEGLEEAMDDGLLSSKLQQTGPHSYDDLMAALRASSYFSDSVIDEMKTEGEWWQFLRLAGIDSFDIDHQEGRPESENIANNIEIETHQVEVLNPTYEEIQPVQTGHRNRSTGRRMVIGGSAIPVGQRANSAPAPVRQNKVNTNSSKVNTRDSSSAVLQSKVSVKEVDIRSDLTDEGTVDPPENTSDTIRENDRGIPKNKETPEPVEKAASEKKSRNVLTDRDTPDVPENAAVPNEKITRIVLTNGDIPDTPENISGAEDANTKRVLTDRDTPDAPENATDTARKIARIVLTNENTEGTNEKDTKRVLTDRETPDTLENVVDTDGKIARIVLTNDNIPDTYENTGGTDEKDTERVLTNRETPDTLENARIVLTNEDIQNAYENTGEMDEENTRSEETPEYE